LPILTIRQIRKNRAIRHEILQQTLHFLIGRQVPGNKHFRSKSRCSNQQDCVYFRSFAPWVKVLISAICYDQRDQKDTID